MENINMKKIQILAIAGLFAITAASVTSTGYDNSPMHINNGTLFAWFGLQDDRAKIVYNITQALGDDNIELYHNPVINCTYMRNPKKNLLAQICGWFKGDQAKPVTQTTVTAYVNTLPSGKYKLSQSHDSDFFLHKINEPFLNPLRGFVSTLWNKLFA